MTGYRFRKEHLVAGEKAEVWVYCRSKPPFSEVEEVEFPPNVVEGWKKMQERNRWPHTVITTLDGLVVELNWKLG